MLGGGSNILLTKNITGLVLHNKISGIKILKEDKETLTMKYKKAIPYLEKGWVINGH